MSDLGHLMEVINRLVEEGNTVVVIEHNLHVIKNADWIIDMGPEGGSKGGQVMFESTPKDLTRNLRRDSAAIIAGRYHSGTKSNRTGETRMVTKNLKSKIQHLMGGLSIGSLVLAGVIAAVPASVANAAPTPQSAPVQPELVRNERLEQAYRREQQWLSTQQDNLNKMNSAADKVQQFIATQQGKGKDVSALEAALATFRSQIATAQSAHTTAANVLSAHPGFDATGKVTNAAQARQTVLEARQSLRDAHTVMRQAVLDLHRAIRAWRQANGLKSSPPVATPSS